MRIQLSGRRPEWFLLPVLLLSFLLTACAGRPPAPVVERTEPAAELALTPEGRGVRQALYRQHERWRGVPYRLGGLGGRGFDCSGLTYIVYRDTFQTHLPRTTVDQARVGRAVDRSALAPGDLVFFKTGVFQRHVGVYVEDDLFLHASRSDGVRLSSLRNGYWRKRYWQARRLQGI